MRPQWLAPLPLPRVGTARPLRCSPVVGDADEPRPVEVYPISGGLSPPAVGRRGRRGFDMTFWDIFVSIFWFMILFTWIWMLIAIVGDIFRDHELSGWGKALWTLFLIVAPWLGSLVYLIARGRSMNERALAQAHRNEQAFGQYVRETAGTGTTSTADELSKLADLRDRGTLSVAEFELAKAKVLGTEPTAAAVAQTDGRAVAATT
jgi:Phospholipase_D-nuclease N-terminal